MSYRTRALIGGASALGIGVLGILPAALPTAASTGIQHFRPGRVMYDVGVHRTVTHAQVLAASAASSRFTQFKAKVKVGTKTFTYVMAGKNPAKNVVNASATIKAVLVPVTIKFGDGNSWTPAKKDSCDSGATPLSRVQKSSVVVSHSWKWGGTSIGKAQYVDAFQRAEFWKYAKPGGINHNYHVRLSWSTHKPITISVPIAQSAEGPIGCGNGLLAGININWLDPRLQKKTIPSLNVSPKTLPIFLLHNAVEFVGNPSQCCILGYHNAFRRSSGVQTYGLAMYDNSGAFSGSSDISALSHEVAEWQDDPYTNNPTPAWGHIGQVTGCQKNLEVADPLTGKTFNDKVGGFTYHPQELAFFSWFYHQKPSLGVHGWYSNKGTFRRFAKKCT